MFTFILFIFSSVALNSAQLNTGPQTFTDQSLFATDNNLKQSVNNQYSFYVAPLQFNAQNENNIRSVQTTKQDNQQLGQQDVGTQQRTYSSYINFSPIEGSQDQNREQVSENASNQKQEALYRQLQEGLKLINSYSEQKPQEQGQLVSFDQGNELQKEFLKSIPKTLYSDKNQEQRNLGEELQQKWSRILGSNRVNLKSLSPLSDDQFLKVQTEKPIIETESNNKEEQGNTEAGNVIEYVLRNHGNNEFIKLNVFGEESNYQNTPFVIQEQGSPISNSNDEQLKATSAISEGNQFFNFGQPEQTNFREDGQKNNEVRQQIEDIIRNSGNIRFGKSNSFGTKQINYQRSPVFNQRYRVSGNNQGELKEKSNNREEEGNAEVRKLIEDIVRNRNNNFGKQNGFRSEQGLSFFGRQQSQQQRPLNNNRVHLKALSTISEDNQFSKGYFGNRS